jgi:N-acetylmuramoyl-L-alanine amidase CwlA
MPPKKKLIVRNKGGCETGRKEEPKGGCKVGKKKLTEPKPKIKLIVRNPGKGKVIGTINYDKVEQELDKSFINNSYQDYIEMFLDGKGSQEKQLEKASGKVSKAITKLLKKTAKEKKFTTNKQLTDYWIKNKKDFGEEL